MVVSIDKRADVGFELPDGGMNRSPEPLSGELSKPTLDLMIHEAEVGVKWTL